MIQKWKRIKLLLHTNMINLMHIMLSKNRQKVYTICQSLRNSTLNIHWKDWFWSWRSSSLATCCEEPTHWKKTLMWWKIEGRREGDDRWDDWMASLTQWTWVGANSRRWWRMGKPGLLQSMGSGVTARHNWVTKQQQIHNMIPFI